TWRLIGAANGYLEQHEPWRHEAGDEVDAVMGDALEAIRLIAVMVSPAMPSVALEVWRRLGLAGTPTQLPFADAAGWGAYPGGLTVVKGEPLFPRRADA
ncbi:MAG: methionine--tRNA ligase, partial [Acidimicrobiales bacterium]